MQVGRVVASSRGFWRVLLLFGVGLTACVSSGSESAVPEDDQTTGSTAITVDSSAYTGRFLDAGLETEPGPLGSFDYSSPAELAADADVVFVATISGTQANVLTLTPPAEENSSIFTEFDAVVFDVEEVLVGDIDAGDSLVVATPTVTWRDGEAKLLDTALNGLIADALRTSEPGRYLVFATQRSEVEVLQFTSNGGFVEITSDGSIGVGAPGSVFGFGTAGPHGHTIGSVRDAVTVLREPDPVLPLARPERDDLSARCGSVEFGSIPPDINEFPALDADAQSALNDLIDEIDGGSLRAWLESYAWRTASRTDAELVLFGQRVEFEQLEFFNIHFERQDNAWESSTFGQCGIGIAAEGFGRASISLGSLAEPQPEATTLELLITEQACAGGTAPVDRQIIAFVEETDDEVFVNVVVEPVDGDAMCPSNPAHPITIELDKPLGSRSIIDASSFPYMPAIASFDN